MAELLLSPDIAAEFILAIRAQDEAAVRGLLDTLGDKAAEAVNTPIRVDGGKWQFLLTEAVNAGGTSVISALLDAGALPEKRAQGDYVQNAFYAPKMTSEGFSLLVDSVRARAGAGTDKAIHAALVGDKGQKTESCLFTLMDAGNTNMVLEVLGALPNDSSRHEALTQLASPLGFAFDKRSMQMGYYLNPERSVTLTIAANFIPSSSLKYTLSSMEYRVENADSREFFNDARRPYDWYMSLDARRKMEKQLKLKNERVSLEELKAWVGEEAEMPLPPPLAKRFTDIISRLVEGGSATSGAFNESASALKALIETFDKDAAEIVNTPILKTDGTRTTLIAEVVAKGNTAALDVMLAAGADPAKRAEGTSGPNAFYVGNAKPLHIQKMVEAVRAKYEDKDAADIALAEALNGAKGHATPPALVYQVDAANYGAAEEIFRALPTKSAKIYAFDYAVSPIDMKVDAQLRDIGTYLSISKCLSVSDIIDIRMQDFSETDYEASGFRRFLQQELYSLSDEDRQDERFYHGVVAKERLQITSAEIRRADEARYRELRGKETQQQQEYRDMLRGALEAREEAEQELRRARISTIAEEKKLRDTAAEITQLEEQVRRNAEVLRGLNDERVKLRQQLKM